jgi:glycosyltransferase involved in cell wall biosynthesis
VSLVSVVVPVYWNAGTLPELLRRFREVARELHPREFEFLLVDDGSGDDSFEQLRREAQADPRVRALRLSRNFGSNLAILAGLTHARGDAVVVIAADLQDPPELIPRLVEAHERGADIVLAARRKREDPFLTRLFAGIFNRAFRRFVFPDFPPNGFDFMLVSRRVARELSRMSEKNSYIFGQVMWLGFRKAVVEYDRVAREEGSSRWTLARKVKYLIDAFTSFSYLPIRAASALGFLMALAGFAWAGVVVVAKLTGGIPVPGFSAVILAVLVTSGTQLLVTGLIGEYLWRILEETRRRPSYLVAETIPDRLLED